MPPPSRSRARPRFAAIGATLLVLVLILLVGLVFADVFFGIEVRTRSARSLLVFIVAIAVGLGASAMGGEAIAQLSGEEPTSRTRAAISLGGGVAAFFLALAFGFRFYVDTGGTHTLSVEGAMVTPTSNTSSAIDVRFEASGLGEGESLWLAVSDREDCGTDLSRGRIDSPGLGTALHFANVPASRISCVRLIVRDVDATILRRSTGLRVR